MATGGSFSNLSGGFLSAELIDTSINYSLTGYSQQNGSSGTFDFVGVGITTSMIDDLYAGDWKVEVFSYQDGEPISTISGIVEPVATPEPSSWMLGLCAGGFAMVLCVQQRRCSAMR